MKKVLIPTDFSDTAFNAAAYAIQLLKDGGCEFYLFHAYKMPQSVGVLISVAEILQQEAADKLANDERRLREELSYPPVGISHLALPGAFHELLPEVVASQGIDLIVMGTQGVKGLADSILGTNTARVIDKIKVPVMVVPNSISYQALNNLVFASDSDFEQGSVNGQWTWVDWMHEHFDTKFTRLHIEDPEELSESHEESYTQAKQQGTAGTTTIPAVIAYRDIDETVYHEDVVEGIMSYIRPSELLNSLLVLVAHKHGWLGKLFHQSVTQKMAMRNEVPLLILHD